MQVAKPALAALRDQCACAVCSEIGDDRPGIGVCDHGADGHPKHDILGAVAVLIRAAAILAALGAMNARIAIVDQRVDVAIRDRVDAAAAAAVAAVGSSARDVLFPAERRDAVAAIAADDFDDRFVEKFHGASRA
jgi:hypothetical protein